jgi:orotate phosphoribosyltransferase
MNLLAFSPEIQRSLEMEKLWAARMFFLKPGVLKASDHGLRSGLKSDYFFDLDYLLNDPYQAGIILDIYSQLIEDIKRETPIDFLAFLEKASGGPVGAIRLSVGLSIRTNLPNLTVRPGKEIFFERIKSHYFESGLRGLRAIIVSDHCTTGGGVISAAEILRDNQINVNHAVVYTIRPEEIDKKKLIEEKIDLRYRYGLPQIKGLPLKIEDLETIAVNY